MYRILTFSMLLLFFFSANSKAQSWSVESDRDGIKIESATESGNTYKTFKGTTTIQSTEEKVIDLMRNVGDYPSWMHGTNSAKLLKPASSDNQVPADIFHNNSSFDFVIHTINDASPLDDRDLISKIKMTKQEGRVTLKMVDDPSYLPEQKGAVRVKDMSGYWQFDYGPDKTSVKVTYQLYNDGDIAFWVPNASVNAKAEEIVLKSLQNMKARLQ